MFKMEPANAPLPGLIDFSLMLSAKTRPGQQPKLVTLGRVLGPDGKPLHEAGYCAQLYCGRQRSHLTPVGELSLVFGGMVGYGGSSLELYNGLLSMQIIQLPNVRPGERFYAQIKVWKRSDGETFEEARDNGGPTGTSEIIIATAGSEIDGARKLIGVRNIRVMPPN